MISNDRRLNSRASWKRCVAALALTVAFVGTTNAAFNLTWTTAVDHTATGLDPTYQLRAVSVADQPSNDSVYIGYIQDTGANNREVDRYSTTNPYPQLNQRLSGSSEQPKGIATDDRGNVFVSYRNSGNTNSYIQSFSSNLATSGGVSPSVAPVVGGIAIHKSGANYYAYVSYEGGGLLQRYDVTNPGSMTLDLTFGTAGSYVIPGAGSLRGLEVGSDGSIYVSSRGDNKVYKVAANLLSVSSATVAAAQDVAIFGGNLFATSYAGTSSAIAVLSLATLTAVDTINITTLDGNAYTRANTSGFSGIDIDSSGRIWLADEQYAGSNSTTKDRLIVGSALAAVPEPTTILVLSLVAVMSPFAIRKMKIVAA